MRLILEHTFATIAGAVLPLGMLHSSVPECIVWRATSFLFAIFFAFQLWITRNRISKLAEHNEEPAHPQLLKYHFCGGTGLLLLLAAPESNNLGFVPSYSMDDDLASQSHLYSTLCFILSFRL